MAIKREIKFRAWDKENKQWAKMRLSDWGSWDGASMSQNYPKDKPEEFEMVNDVKYAWCQFTGLKDKNDKEIYEGDVVKMWSNGLNSTVEFRKSGFYVISKSEKRESAYMLHQRNKWIEIIGNQFENPELLTKNL